MPSALPDWLQSALTDPLARHDGLAIARLGDAKVMARGSFSLTSPAFAAGEELDPCFTGDEEDAVAPPLEWSAPPPGAMELVLIVEDASSPADADPTCHWLVWGLPAQKGMLLEGEVPPRVGKNAQRNSEWLLPAPPHEDEPHRYVFQLFAVDLPLTLMPGASRDEVIASIEGHVVAASLLVGTYARQDDDEEDFEDFE